MFDRMAITLHNAIAAVCPIDGVYVNPADQSRQTWRIDFAAGASDEQKAAAQKALIDFVPPASS